MGWCRFSFIVFVDYEGKVFVDIILVYLKIEKWDIQCIVWLLRRENVIELKIIMKLIMISNNDIDVVIVYICDFYNDDFF